MHSPDQLSDAGIACVLMFVPSWFDVCHFQNFSFLAAPLKTAEYIFTSFFYISVQMMQANSFLFLFQFCRMCCSKYLYSIQWNFYLFINFALTRPRLFSLFMFPLFKGEEVLVGPQLSRSWYILDRIAFDLKLWTLVKSVDYEIVSQLAILP